MHGSLYCQVRRVAVEDEVATTYDYADAFELRADGSDVLAPRTWLGAGLEDAPAVARWLTALLLRVRDEAATSPDDFSDWQVLESTPELIHVERSLPLLHVVLIGRRLDPSGRRLTTLLTYERPVLARLVWAVVGVGHRLAARRLICHGITAVEPTRTEGRR